MFQKYIWMAIAFFAVLVAGVCGYRYTALRFINSIPTNSAMIPPANVRVSYADRQIQKASRYLKTFPEKYEGYALLASGYLLKSRETGDFGFNTRAQECVQKALTLNAQASDVINLKAQILVTEHRFLEALQVAEQAQEIDPQFPDVYGTLTDSLVELGRYDQAVKAAQKMVDLRPDTASYSRVSYLRWLHGDEEGAIEAMEQAVKAAPPENREQIAWCLVHLGQLWVYSKQPANAEACYAQALELFPGYPPALIAKGKVRFAAGDLSSAVDLVEQAMKRIPSPETAIILGNLYLKTSNYEAAHRQYETARYIETSGSTIGATYSRQMAIFWADRDQSLDQAVALVERELQARSDIFTCDAAAWCYAKQGRLTEAETWSKQALRLGTKDPQIHYHAGMIVARLGKLPEARKHLEQALSIDPAFDVIQAEVARQMLRQIKETDISR